MPNNFVGRQEILKLRIFLGLKAEIYKNSTRAFKGGCIIRTTNARDSFSCGKSPETVEKHLGA